MSLEHSWFPFVGAYLRSFSGHFCFHGKFLPKSCVTFQYFCTQLLCSFYAESRTQTLLKLVVFEMPNLYWYNISLLISTLIFSRMSLLISISIFFNIDINIFKKYQNNDNRCGFLQAASYPLYS